MSKLRLTILFVVALPALWADTVAYKYDDAGRLIRADYGNGASISYTYDNAGNLLSRVVSSAAATPASGPDKPVTQQRSKPAATSKKGKP